MKIIESLKSRMNKIDRNKSIVFSFPILFFLLITFIVVLADPVPTRSVEITSNYSGTGTMNDPYVVDESVIPSN